MTKYIQRKEIAQALEVSYNTVKANEARWGLVKVSGFRQTRFIRDEARAKLVKQGMQLPQNLQ